MRIIHDGNRVGKRLARALKNLLAAMRRGDDASEIDGLPMRYKTYEEHLRQVGRRQVVIFRRDGYTVEGKRIRFGRHVLTVPTLEPWHRVKSIRFALRKGVWIARVNTSIAVRKQRDICGIDLGIGSLVTVSNNETYRLPAAVSAIYLASAFVSPKTRADMIRDAARIKRDAIRDIVAQLLHRYRVIALERINIRSFRHAATRQQLRRAGWLTLVSTLQREAKKAGTQLVYVDPAWTSSECAACGHRLATALPLHVRQFNCPKCGYSEQRDTNAARNILRKAYNSPCTNPKA